MSEPREGELHLVNGLLRGVTGDGFGKTQAIQYTGMGYMTHQNSKAGRGLIAWLLLCGMLFGALSPVRAASPLGADAAHPTVTAPAKTQCRMASTPKPCCCPIGHNAEMVTPAPSVEPGACSCSVRPAPVAPSGNPEPAVLINTATPLVGIVPATLPIAQIAPRFAAVAVLRPAFSIGPPLRSPPRSADYGRAPPAFLS